MARPSKTDQEIGYVKDYWNEARTIEADHKGIIVMSVHATPRPGVVVVRLVFTPMFGGVENGLGVVSTENVYPNAERSTFWGFMWRKVIALGYQIRITEQANKSARSNGS